MIKSSIRPIKMGYNSPTKASKTKTQTSQLRTSKKPSPNKSVQAKTKTNLSKRPLDAPNLKWDSGKLCMEILSPKIVKNSVKFDNNTEGTDLNFSSGSRERLNNSGNLKDSGKSSLECASEHVDTLQDKINLAKELSNQLNGDSMTMIRDYL